MTTESIISEILAERERQISLWGEDQRLPLHGGISVAYQSARGYECLADYWKKENDRREKAENVGYDGILLEEVYEALAEHETPKAREEMIQVAAVAIKIIESLDKHGVTLTE